MRIALMLLPVALAACATTAPNNPITINTVSKGQVLAGTNCIVTKGNGNWNVTAPVTLNVGAANSDLRVVCSKPGYRTSEVMFTPYQMSNSNLGIGVGGGGGNVGVGVGLNFPVGMRRGDYPSHITVDMSPQ